MNERNIGLVLDGGGGKGAYQIGVWRALRETGLDKRIVQISGTSVGGLNAALMVQGDYKTAEKIWFEELNTLSLSRIQMWVAEMIDKYLDLSVFQTSPIECWITATCVSDDRKSISCFEPSEELINKYQCGKAHYFNMRNCSLDQRSMLLKEKSLNNTVMLATCALPVLCTSKRINGLRYRDGGIADNSPARPIADVPQIWDHVPKCDYLIVIHLDPVRYDHNPKRWHQTKLLQITPNSDLGGFFNGTVNFDPQNTRQLADAGYADSLPLFQAFLKDEGNSIISDTINQAYAELHFEQIIRNLSALELSSRILRKEKRHE